MESGRSSTSFYKNILDHMLEGCQILDFDWRYIYLNLTAQKHNRRPNDELMGKIYHEMWPGIEKSAVFELINTCMKERISQHMINEFTFPDESKGCFELRISPVPEGVLIMSLDITEISRTEQALENAREQLRQAQKLEAVGQLAGGVAHDFNNILGVILGHTEMAMEMTDHENPIYSDLQEIRQATLRSADLTRQLLAFARKQTVDPRILDINIIIEGFLKLLRRLIGEDVTLKWMPGRKLHQVRMDPSQIEQILTNLCVNARDAITGIGQITIETDNSSIDRDYCIEHPTFHPGDYAVLSVSDNGTGIDKEVMDRIFEPFFTTKGLGHGTGLGLATVYGIVKQNSGFINVYSEKGIGTVFRIYIPVCEGQSQSVIPENNFELKDIGNETILMVEDEPGILKMTKIMLERLGYHVLSAHNATEAIELAKRYPSPIHLLITDVIMPDMTGPDLSTVIKDIVPEAKHLFTSGYTDNVIVQRGVLKSGVFFLPKPFSRKQLGNKIREILD